MTDLLAQLTSQARADRRAENDKEHRSLEAKFEARLAEVERRCKAVPGRLPPVKTWYEGGVTYEGEIAAHDGALWQARCDTGQRPGGDAWVCVARAGRDAVMPTVRRKYNAYEKYAYLDIAEFEGSSFVARRDNPGICPGDGWQLLARGKTGNQGRPGPRGETGAKGEKGDPALEIASWLIDRERYRAVAIMSNGLPGPALELRGLFEQFLQEVGGQMGCDD